MKSRPNAIYTTAGVIALVVASLAAGAFLLRGRSGEAAASPLNTPTRAQATKGLGSRVLVGKIEPGKVLSIVAPFDGVVAQHHADIGTPVAKGDLLFVMDSPDILADYRSATISVKSAELKLRETIEWQTSVEVRTAQRSLERARQMLEESRQRLGTTERLYHEGLVSRDDATANRTAFQDAERDVIAQAEVLDGLKERNSSTQRAIAQLEYENALAKQRSVRKLLNQARVEADFAGVVLPSQVSSRGMNEPPSAELAKGARVARGTTLVTIGDVSSLRVRVAVHEMDLHVVQSNKAVCVTGPAFPGLELPGVIESVSAQANIGPTGPTQMFAAIVRISHLTREQSQALRIGMSADVLLSGSATESKPCPH